MKPRVIYCRSTVTVTDQRGQDGKVATGRLGVIICGSLLLHALERADRYKWLRPGVYDAEHAFWTPAIRTDPEGKKRRVVRHQSIRILGDYSKGRIYLPHFGNWAFELKGCVVAGLGRLPDGVSKSRPGLKQLWIAQGGFEEGASLKVEVQGLPTLPSYR